MSEQQDNQERWPGVDRAYDFVLPSYQLLVARFEAADNRIQSVLTFAATVALGIPVFGKAVRPALSLESRWLWAALAIFAGIAIIGVAGRARGSLRLVNPGLLYEKWLDRSEWVFRKDMVFFAGQDFAANSDAIRRKGNCALVMASLFIVMAFMFLGWLTTGAR
jgi:hypothetical protein